VRGAIHPAVVEAIQQIDAALFNGDTFDDPENRAELKRYVESWLRCIEEDEQRFPDDDDDEDAPEVLT
jgi:aminoglycoside phosphotransferase (APT) family kinase protein